MTKRIYKIHCFECEATMTYRDSARAKFEAITHSDLYNHDVQITNDTVSLDMLFELEGY